MIFSRKWISYQHYEQIWKWSILWIHIMYDMNECYGFFRKWVNVILCYNPHVAVGVANAGRVPTPEPPRRLWRHGFLKWHLVWNVRKVSPVGIVCAKHDSESQIHIKGSLECSHGRRHAILQYAKQMALFIWNHTFQGIFCIISSFPIETRNVDGHL